MLMQLTDVVGSRRVTDELPIQLPIHGIRHHDTEGCLATLQVLTEGEKNIDQTFQDGIILVA
jgi:hypothetical protein